MMSISRLLAVMLLPSHLWEKLPGSAMMRLENPREAVVRPTQARQRLPKIRSSLSPFAVLCGCAPFALGRCPWPGWVVWDGESMVIASSLIARRPPIPRLVRIPQYPRGTSLMVPGQAVTRLPFLALVMTTISSIAGKLISRMRIGVGVGRVLVWLRRSTRRGDSLPTPFLVRMVGRSYATMTALRV